MSEIITMKRLYPLALGLSLAILTSCGGGGSQIAEGGIGGTGITMGKITSFGSIYVTGVKFDVSDASFIYEEDTLGDETDLRVGMVVRISGSHDGVTGVAEIVEYASLLEGTLSSNLIGSNQTGTLVAMGQTVSVDADTVYDDGGLGVILSALPLGAVIEVSGFSDGNGNILASRIDAKALGYSAETLMVKGLVSDLDDVAAQFTLGTLNIDYSATTLPSEITDGVYVEAKGTLQQDRLIATEIELEDDGDLVIAADGEEAELEGLVSAILTPTLFMLNGQQVLVEATTVFEPAGDASSLMLGQPLAVAGIMDGITLVAKKIELQATAGEKEALEAIIEQVDLTDNSVRLLGQSVRTTTSTIFEDELEEAEDTQSFNLGSLQPGDYVSIDLFRAADGVLEATKLERDSAPEEGLNFAEIEGFVQSVDLDRLMLMVVNVMVDISDLSLSGFTPMPGDRVEIKGFYDPESAVLQATEISAEDD
jgi:hypothetical protein